VKPLLQLAESSDVRLPLTCFECVEDRSVAEAAPVTGTDAYQNRYKNGWPATVAALKAQVGLVAAGGCQALCRCCVGCVGYLDGPHACTA
jgi:hypothetical protein